MPELILASASPRRRSLLEQAGFAFRVIPSTVDEDRVLREQVSPYDAVKVLAEKKAAAVCKELKEPAIVVAADTLVSLHGRVLGKPENREAAAAMLGFLQGKEHSVYTGLCVTHHTADGDEIKSVVETTAVFMRRLSDEEIAAYVRTGEPLDKAGAYGIQGKGALLVERVEGDFYTVVGLPMVRLYQILREFGYDAMAGWEDKNG